MKDEQRPVEPGPVEHWFARDMASQPCYGAVESPARAVQEAVAELGCHVPVEAIRRHLADRGQEIDPAMIERVIAELKAQAPGTNPCA